jgi:glycosyltransferase involved in cell wall biosynthesis
MLVTTEDRNGTKAPAAPETKERRHGEAPERGMPYTNGAHAAGRKPAPLLLAPPRDETRPADARAALAAFCYDDPGSVVAEFVAQVAGALTRRGVALHVFSRKGFEVDAPGAAIHVVGEGDEEGLLDRVQGFTHRACNAFLKQFPGGGAPVTLLGCEWSAAPALSLLRGVRNLPTILSLHSVERQRSDLTSDEGQRIEEIELSGLREARVVLVHDTGTAEVVRQVLPECADRTVCARERFPVHQFRRDLDPGVVKARFEVGPIDPTILFVGDLEGRYGPDLLVKAMPAVLRNNPQARLIVVGAGDDYWPLRVYSRYLLLEHAVRLPGSVEGEALCELIQAADVIAVPSREATPWWPILGAWAAGRPVVATHEAAPGLLEHEADSVLCYPAVNSCVWGLERVLCDAEMGHALARRGTRKLDERFGWGAVAAQVEELMGVASHR